MLSFFSGSGGTPGPDLPSPFGRKFLFYFTVRPNGCTSCRVVLLLCSSGWVNERTCWVFLTLFESSYFTYLDVEFQHHGRWKETKSKNKGKPEGNLNLDQSSTSWLDLDVLDLGL